MRARTKHPRLLDFGNLVFLPSTLGLSCRAVCNMKLAAFFLSSVGAIGAQTLNLGPAAFTAPGRFPTSVYSSYYNNPTQTSEQVQPIITDPVLVRKVFYTWV